MQQACTFSVGFLAVSLVQAIIFGVGLNITMLIVFRAYGRWMERQERKRQERERDQRIRVAMLDDAKKHRYNK